MSLCCPQTPYFPTHSDSKRQKCYIAIVYFHIHAKWYLAKSAQQSNLDKLYYKEMLRWMERRLPSYNIWSPRPVLSFKTARALICLDTPIITSSLVMSWGSFQLHKAHRGCIWSLCVVHILLTDHDTNCIKIVGAVFLDPLRHSSRSILDVEIQKHYLRLSRLATWPGMRRP